jgi:hypothetical protein
MPVAVKFKNGKLKGSGSLKPEVAQVKQHIKSAVDDELRKAKKHLKHEVKKAKKAVVKDKNVKRVIKRTKKVVKALK